MSKNTIGSKYKFLEELSELTKKYNISIGGCGCCGSPYLINLKDKTLIGEYISWDEDEQVYKMVFNF